MIDRGSAPPAREPASVPAATAAPATGSVAELVDAVHRDRPMIGAMLDQAGAVTLDAGRLTIRFAEGMEACKRQVESRDALKLLRRHAERLSGRSIEVRVELARDGKPPAPSEPKADTRREPREPAKPRAEAPGERGTPPPAHGPAGSSELLERARRQPGVQKLLDAFGGHVVDVRDGKTRKPRTGPPDTAPPPEETP